MRTLDDFAPKVGPICGVDEAGRGPVMGPIVVAGVLVDDDTELMRIGVRDSKRLTPARREQLVKEVMAVSRYEIVTASADDIDVLRQSMTMNVMESKLFATVIEKLGGKIAYVDAADTNEEVFAKYISNELGGKVKIISKHGADDLYPVVSAASIVAKTRRDAMIEEIKEELGQDIGSGYPSDPKTINFLKSWYTEHGEMPPHTRRSWKTVDRIISELSMTRIDKYEE
ncbi:MAG: ribonuclease HII [Candidatus Thermoplasmatota archaeon]|nr:ribonuclease HII [Euryarchaeota archaeon]MBU4031613.1 ribonuclease HII [Candidatus Thermoplasmatota archaeon]MBU4072398.1 ribonuclease HII [Candidatus Thermoplasmatota archaeon]MBU4144933.1 ribonuclease HII [Candidatus Thermoplasmatota archaeon]MBU4591688.1 ribonuclease HII [Candidatus Thermoplasmatota archaeon]